MLESDGDSRGWGSGGEGAGGLKQKMPTEERMDIS